MKCNEVREIKKMSNTETESEGESKYLFVCERVSKSARVEMDVNGVRCMFARVCSAPLPRLGPLITRIHDHLVTLSAE